MVTAAAESTGGFKHERTLKPPPPPAAPSPPALIMASAVCRPKTPPSLSFDFGDPFSVHVKFASEQTMAQIKSVKMHAKKNVNRLVEASSRAGSRL